MSGLIIFVAVVWLNVTALAADAVLMRTVNLSLTQQARRDWILGALFVAMQVLAACGLAWHIWGPTDSQVP